MKNDSLDKGRVLVTGGSGFIGGALCLELIDHGYEVWVLTRDVPRASRHLNKQVHLVSGLSELAGVAFVALINLAGESLGGRRWNEQSKQLFRQSRIDFTNTLYRFFADQQLFPAVVINASAIGIYGDAGSSILNESAAVGDGFAAQLCRDWELAARQFASNFTRLCIIRIGVVLDSHGGALKQILPAFRCGLGGRMGAGEHYMSWISRHDLIRLFIYLLEHGDASGVYNAVAPEPVTNSEFTARLAEQLNRPALLPMPAMLLRLLFGEMADALLLASQRVMPERILQSGFSFEYPRLQTAFEKIFGK